MPSSKDYLDYVLDLLEKVDNVTYKRMMGEYLLYSDKTLFGGIYDNRFLIKKNGLESFGLKEEIPYPKGKPMYLVDTENKEEISNIIYKLLFELKGLD